MAAHAASRSVPRSPAPREDWLDRAREGLEPIQALTALLQRLTAPGGNVTSTRREKIDRIVRSAIEQHLSGPTFAWFGSWVFARQDGRRLILRVKGGVAEIFAYYRRR